MSTRFSVIHCWSVCQFSVLTFIYHSFFLFSFNAVIVCISKRSWNSLYVNARVDEENKWALKALLFLMLMTGFFHSIHIIFSFTTHSAKRYSTNRRRRSHKNFIMCTIYINKHPPYPSQWTQCAIQSVWKTGPNVTWV